MVSVAIWLVSCGRNFTHALPVFADLGAENGFNPDECEPCNACWASLAPGENLTDVGYACVKEPSVVSTPWGLSAPPFWRRTIGRPEIRRLLRNCDRHPADDDQAGCWSERRT